MLAEDEEITPGNEVKSFTGADEYAEMSKDSQTPPGVIEDPGETAEVAAATKDDQETRQMLRQRYERAKALADLMNELRLQYEALDTAVRGADVGESQTQATGELEDFIEQAVAKVQAIRGDEVVVDRKEVIEGLIDRGPMLGARYAEHKRFGSKELAQEVADAESELTSIQKKIATTEDITLALYRHPEIVDIDGQPLAANNVGRLVRRRREALRAISAADAHVRAIEGNRQFDDSSIWEALNSFVRQDKLSEEDVDELRALLRDDDSTLGLIKQKAVELVRRATEKDVAMAEEAKPIIDQVEAALQEVRASSGST